MDTINNQESQTPSAADDEVAERERADAETFAALSAAGRWHRLRRRRFGR